MNQANEPAVPSAPSPAPSPASAPELSFAGEVRDDGRSAVFFTSADVRSMSREQVRDNLERILASMALAGFEE